MIMGITKNHRLGEGYLGKDSDMAIVKKVNACGNINCSHFYMYNNAHAFNSLMR